MWLHSLSLHHCRDTVCDSEVSLDPAARLVRISGLQQVQLVAVAVCLWEASEGSCS